MLITPLALSLWESNLRSWGIDPHLSSGGKESGRMVPLWRSISGRAATPRWWGCRWRQRWLEINGCLWSFQVGSGEFDRLHDLAPGLEPPPFRGGGAGVSGRSHQAVDRGGPRPPASQAGRGRAVRLRIRPQRHGHPVRRRRSPGGVARGHGHRSSLSHRLGALRQARRSRCGTARAVTAPTSCSTWSARPAASGSPACGTAIMRSSVPAVSKPPPGPVSACCRRCRGARVICC